LFTLACSHNPTTHPQPEQDKNALSVVRDSLVAICAPRVSEDSTLEDLAGLFMDAHDGNALQRHALKALRPGR
jgi:hypothetical protein